MTVRYQVGKFGEGEFSRPLGLRIAMGRLRLKLSEQKGPYHVREHEDEWGPWRPLNDTLKRVKTRINGADIGTRLIIAPHEGSSYSIRKVEVEPPVMDTIGNERIDRIYTFVFKKYSFAQNWGIYNCRKVAGSSTYSQHAWANALDVGASTPEQLAIVAQDLVRAQEPGGELENIVQTVIVANRVWRKGDGWLPYTGIYHSHVHVDASPNYSGTPPCA
jgi:hypothetical protein